MPQDRSLRYHFWVAHAAALNNDELAEIPDLYEENSAWTAPAALRRFFPIRNPSLLWEPPPPAINISGCLRATGIAPCLV